MSLTRAQKNAVAQLLRVAPAIGELGELFRDAGHELYLVGGSVRDAMLDELGHDLDFATSARPDQTEAVLRRYSSATWDVGRAFGTIGARKRGDGADWIVEVTTYRADAYRPQDRHPEVRFGDDIVGDLARRDFTINAMALDLENLRFVDPFGGLADLAAGLIRTPGAPSDSFGDDPLRMMRAARFASQLGFKVSPDVVAAMCDMAHRLEIVSGERIRGELSALLLTRSPRAGLNLLVDTGVADVFLPELGAMRLERDEHMRHKDVYEHSLTVLERSIALEAERGLAPDLVGRLAALLHDIGKPATRRLEGRKVTFHHHDVVGAKMARKRLRKLCFSAAEIKSVCALIELHLRFHGYSEAQWTDSAVRRYVRDAGPELERLHILTRSDCTTRNQAKAARLERAYDDLERRIAELGARERLDAMRPDLNGDQIMALLGVGPGPIVGEAYKHLLGLRLDEGPLGEEEAERRLLAWWDARGGARDAGSGGSRD